MHCGTQFQHSGLGHRDAPSRRASSVTQLTYGFELGPGLTVTQVTGHLADATGDFACLKPNSITLATGSEPVRAEIRPII